MKKFSIGLALTLASTLSMAAQECHVDFSKSTPNIRYEFNDNGTVKDKITGLTWMRCAVGQKWNAAQETCTGDATGMFWQAALNEVESINQSESHALHKFGDKQKWRMPNIKELVSLAEFSCRTPAMNIKAFSGAFDTHTSDADLTSYIWSNHHLPGATTIMTFDTRNAQVFSYGAAQAKLGVLLVADE